MYFIHGKPSWTPSQQPPGGEPAALWFPFSFRCLSILPCLLLPCSLRSFFFLIFSSPSFFHSPLVSHLSALLLKFTVYFPYSWSYFSYCLLLSLLLYKALCFFFLISEVDSKSIYIYISQSQSEFYLQVNLSVCVSHREEAKSLSPLQNMKEVHPSYVSNCR